MCYMFYIGANHVIPTFETSLQYPEIRVAITNKQIKKQLKDKFDTKYIYFVGSWQGCGCGFSYEEEVTLEETLAHIPDKDTIEHARRVRERGVASVQSLSNLLAAHAGVETILLYVTWAGDEHKQVQHRKYVAPSYFGGVEFTSPEEGTMFFVSVEAKERMRNRV